MNLNKQILTSIAKYRLTKNENNDDEDNDGLDQLKSLMNSPVAEQEKNHIYFYNEVTEESCLDLNRKIVKLNKELLKYSIEYEIEPPNIYLHINSFGGSLFAAFSTIDTIINSKVPIISIIEGNAASAATIISMVCHKRYITHNSFMLVHQLATYAFGKSKYEESKDSFMNDTSLMELIYKLYLENTTMNLTNIKKILQRDIWWNAEKCLKNGLVDDFYNGSFINVSTKTHFGNNIFTSNNTLTMRDNRNTNKTNDILNVLNNLKKKKKTALKREQVVLDDSESDEQLQPVKKKKKIK